MIKVDQINEENSSRFMKTFNDEAVVHNVSGKFVSDRNQLMAILNQESSLMEIVKLIGSDVLPDDQKLTLEIARVIRLGFLQQNAFHALSQRLTYIRVKRCPLPKKSCLL